MKQVREEQLRSRLREVWANTRELVEERVELLESATARLRAGSLENEERFRAVSTAHKLAGTLGMFGMSEASECAKAIEEMYAHDKTDERLGAVVARLRALVSSKAASMGDRDESCDEA